MFTYSSHQDESRIATNLYNSIVLKKRQLSRKLIYDTMEKEVNSPKCFE